MTNITAKIAQFVANVDFDDIPKLAVERAVDAITDCVGVALAGSREPMIAILRETLDAAGSGTGPAHVIGSDRGASWLDAALINGTMAHAIDYDDTAHPSYSHPTSHLFPALLSLGSLTHASGKDVVTAYSVGLELEGKLGRGMNFGHYGKGWHASGTFGTVTTAAACARLLELPASRVQQALGIAASCSAGSRANFGTMTKPLHAGNAARNGMYAATLASKGFTATATVFEDRSGYFGLFGGTGGVDGQVFSRLGSPWEVLSPIGLALKAYPSCGATHPAIEAASILAADVDVDEIESVRVGVSEQVPQILVYDNPSSALQGKFSMQYCISSALLRGTVDRGTFTDEILHSERMQSLVPKVSMEVDDRVRHSTEFGAAVSIKLRDGTEMEEIIELAKGKPARWLSPSELFAKFQDCSRGTLPNGRRKALFENLQDLVSIDDISSIGAAATAPRPST